MSKDLFDEYFNLNLAEEAGRACLPIGAWKARLILIQTKDHKVKKMYFRIGPIVYRVVLEPLKYEGYEVLDEHFIRRFTPDGKLLYTYISEPGTLVKIANGEREQEYTYAYERDNPIVNEFPPALQIMILGWAEKDDGTYVYFNTYN